MNQLMWRLHRHEFYVATAVLVAFVLSLTITVFTGVHLGDNPSIPDLLDLTVFIPLLFGVFCGAPLLSKEFEDGTHNLIWTQGVTRWHWFWATAGWAVLIAAAWGTAMSGVITWWLSARGLGGTRFESSINFDIQGFAPVAYTIFAVALGIAIGARAKRLVPAMATTLVAFVVIRVVIQKYARPHFMSPHTVLVPLNASPVLPPAGIWQIAEKTTSRGYLYTFQPANRFWAFQGIETAIFLVLAVAALAIANWTIAKHDA